MPAGEIKITANLVALVQYQAARTPYIVKRLRKTPTAEQQLRDLAARKGITLLN
jgi:hypothetical protein